MNSRVYPKYKTKYRVGTWREHERALALNPDLPEAHQLYTAFELDQGRPTEAMVRLVE